MVVVGRGFLEEVLEMEVPPGGYHVGDIAGELET